MSTLQQEAQRSLSASRTPLPSIRLGDDVLAPRPKVAAGSDVARQRAWLSGIEAEDFYANVPCTD